MDYKNITEDDVRNWVKNNRSTTNDVPYMMLAHLANSEITLDEFREWILENKRATS